MRNMPGPSPSGLLRRASHNHEADRASFTESAGSAGPIVGNHLAAFHGETVPAHGPAVSGVLEPEFPGGPQTLPITPRSACAGLVGVSVETAYPHGQPARQQHARSACVAVAVAHAVGSAGGFAATTAAWLIVRPGCAPAPVSPAAAFDSRGWRAPATALDRRHGCS